MNDQQVFWTNHGGDAYTKRTLEFVNTRYTDGFRFDIIRNTLAEIPRDATILELGCNRGNFIGFLKKLGFTNITGVEINQSAYKKCKERFPEFEFINKSIEDYFRELPFDLVITCGVLIHIHSDNLLNIVKKIRELSRKYIFGNEYYSKDFRRVVWPSYCYSGDYANIFGIKPKIELYRVRKNVKAKIDVFYLIEK